MPTIPLFNEGQTVKTPQVQPPPQGRRLQVVMDLNGAAQGFATPLLPEALADRSGGIAMGQAMGQLGGALMELGRKKQEAQDITDVNEADMAMTKAAADFEVHKTNNTDERTWPKEWDLRMATLPEQLYNDKQSGNARRAIEQRFKLFQVQQGTSLAVASAKQAFGKAGETFISNATNKLDQGDFEGFKSLMEEGVKLGYINGGKAAHAVRDGGQRLTEKQWNAQIINGDLSGAEKTIEESPFYPTRDDKDIALFGARSKNKQLVEMRTSQENAAFLGGVILERANGAVFAPAQINAWVNAKKLKPEQAAHLIEQYNTDTPAPAAEFNDLINQRVLKYDPTTDKTGEVYESILRAGVTLGMDQIQAQRLQSNLQAVIDRNKTAPGRTESHIRSWANDHINDLMKAGAFGEVNDTSKAMTVLGDTSELQRWGLTESAAKRIAALKGPERINEFKRAKEERTLNPEEYNKLSDGTKNVFKEVEEGKFSDPNSPQAVRAAAKAAEMQDRVDTWFSDFHSKNSRQPTQKEVQGAVNDITKGARAGATWQPFNPPVEAPQASTEPGRYKVEADGSFSGTASSYGYEGDADNGYNSMGMKRGEQPWFGHHPTVALSPETAKALGVRVPRYSDGSWDTSHSMLEIEVNGKKTKAIFDETGMYLDPRSKDKLIDLTPEASVALGVPIKTNAANVKVRKAFS